MLAGPRPKYTLHTFKSLKLEQVFGSPASAGKQMLKRSSCTKKQLFKGTTALG